MCFVCSAKWLCGETTFPVVSEGTGGHQIFGDQGIDSMAKWWEGQWDDLGLGGCWVLWDGGGDLLSIMGDTLCRSRGWVDARHTLETH